MYRHSIDYLRSVDCRSDIKVVEKGSWTRRTSQEVKSYEVKNPTFTTSVRTEKEIEKE